MELNKKSTISFWIVGLFILILGIYFGVTLGVNNISIGKVIESITNYSNDLDTMLIRDVRIPRAICVLIVGGLLGVTGAMIQGVTRNPIAEPSLLGVSQGATLVIAIFYAMEITINTTNTMIASSIGAIISGVMVIAFVSTKANNSVSKLLLAGTAISTFFISLTTIIGLLSNRAQFIAFWVSGGFKSASWSDVMLLLIVGIPCMIVVLLMSYKINILSLGDDVAIGLGQNPSKIRFIILLLMIPMCAAAVAVGKNIVFLGLIVPQIVKKILGEDYRRNIPFSFLLGAIILSYADIAARLLFSPYETPVGVFTALIGLPFFIYVARKERG